MLKNRFYVYAKGSLTVPAHCNYGKEILDKIKTFGNAIALIDADSSHTMTYSELVQQTVDITLSLAHMGVKRGDMVGICSEKRMEVIPSILGIVCAGATYSPLDVTSGEGVREFIMFGEHIDGLPFSQFLEKKAPVDQFVPASVDGWNDNLCVTFSSGTTGMPKGVPITHYKFLVMDGRNNSESKRSFGVKILNTREWCHTYGLLHSLASLHAGATLLFSPTNRPEDQLRAIQDYKVCVMQVCPTTIAGLVKTDTLDKYDLSSLMVLVNSGAYCDPELETAVKKRCPNLRDVYQFYGMTEAGVVCTELEAPFGHRPGSVGCLYPGVVAKVVDLVTRKPLGPNQRGEICIKSLSLMKGYLCEVPKDYIDEENFYKTGDVGYYDEDEYFYIVDRAKDLIKFYDLSVAPAEFESILLQHLAVREAGVVGAPHPVSGEAPTAFVVLQPGMEVTAEELCAMVDQHVSSTTKLEGGVRFVEKLPRNSGLKLDRKALLLML